MRYTSRVTAVIAVGMWCAGVAAMPLILYCSVLLAERGLFGGCLLLGVPLWTSLRWVCERWPPWRPAGLPCGRAAVVRGPDGFVTVLLGDPTGRPRVVVRMSAALTAADPELVDALVRAVDRLGRLVAGANETAPDVSGAADESGASGG